MITWVIIFIVGGAILGFLLKGKEGAAAGAIEGLIAFMAIAVQIILPLALMFFLFRACT